MMILIIIAYICTTQPWWNKCIQICEKMKISKCDENNIMVNSSAVITQYNITWDCTHHCSKCRQNINQRPQKTPQTSPWWASCGVSFVNILEETDRLIMAPHCISIVGILQRPFCHTQGDPQIEGLEQETHISSVSAMELRIFCTRLSIYHKFNGLRHHYFMQLFTIPVWGKENSPQGHYHGCWCPGSMYHQGSKSHDFDSYICGMHLNNFDCTNEEWYEM